MTQPATENPSWGTDVPISMPEPVEYDPDLSADMGSHVFTEDGLRIALNRATLQETYAPTYAPPPPGGMP